MAEDRSTDSTPKPEWVKRWLEVMRDTGNVRLSCYACKIERSTPYHLKDRDPEFARLWAEAEEDATDALEAEARRRAKKQSDTLIMFLLKAHRPAKYRETTRVDLAILKAPNEQLIDLVLGAGEDVAAREAVGSSSAEAAGRGPGSALPAGSSSEGGDPLLPEHADSEAG